MHYRFALCLAFSAPLALNAQIPPSETLSPADTKSLQTEVQRLKGLLDTAGDKCTVSYALARTWAGVGQYRQALAALQDAIDLNVGLDPSRDQIFQSLRRTNEFNLMMRQVRDDTPAIANSKLAFTIDQPRLMPEGIAWEPRRKHFFFGSTWGHNIVECIPDGDCKDLVPNGQYGLFEVLGIKADPRDRSIWAASNSPKEAGVFHYDPVSGALVQKFVMPRENKGPYFNDLAISSKGDVYVTDTQGGTVFLIAGGTGPLKVFDPNLKVEAANGIALSDDDSTLYVAGFPDGLTVVNLVSKAAHAIKHPANLCLGNIDGLSSFKGSLIAIQNGVMTPRVVRFKLTADRQEIASFDVLKRRNPAFNGITTGAIADGAFYFMANTQLDKANGGRIKPGVQFDPVKILRIDLN